MAVRFVFVLSCFLGWIGLAAAQTVPVVPVAATEVKKFLQVPSPDWRDQVIYFAMTDRFNDGDPSNSDQKAGEFDPASNAKYSGGDLAGLTAKLDYIKGMGMTSVWIIRPWPTSGGTPLSTTAAITATGARISARSTSTWVPWPTTKGCRPRYTATVCT